MDTSRSSNGGMGPPRSTTALSSQQRVLKETQDNNMTQSSQRTNRPSVESFCQNMLRYAEKMNNVNSSSQGNFKQNMEKVFTQISDEKKLNKVWQHLEKVSLTDEGLLLSQFSASWCRLLTIIDNPAPHRLAIAKLILTIAEKYLLSGHCFVSIYNTLVEQTALLAPSDFTPLLQIVSQVIINNKELTVSQRWKDCVLIILNRAQTLSIDDSLRDSVCAGIETVSCIVSEWLRRSRGVGTFTHVVDMAKQLDQMATIDDFLDNEVFPQISDPSQRREMTEKGIIMMPHLEAKALARLTRVLMCEWVVREDAQEDSAPTGPAPAIECACLLIQQCEQHANVFKAVQAVLKTDRGIVLCSELGFPSVIGLCGIERYTASIVPEVRRCFQRLWRFGESTEGGKADAGEAAANMINIVKTQWQNLPSRLAQCDRVWKAVGEPAVLIAQQLCECNKTARVTIVAGRVHCGPSLSLLSGRALSSLLLSRPEKVDARLPPLLHAIAAAPNPQTALILIDVLVDVVRKCSLAVLNNWKQLEGIFEWVCRMDSQVSVALIRCLLPVINHRGPLRQALYDNIKKELMCQHTVASAVPLLLLLFRSVAGRGGQNTTSSQTFSQSFATFSSQSLRDMGCARNTNDQLKLEVVGTLKRCLAQAGPTRALLYTGICEVVHRSPNMVGACLDLLVSHAATSPVWKASDMVSSSANTTLCQLNEPLPMMVQALETLTCSAVSALQNTSSQLSQAAGGDVLIEKASAQLEEWVARAGRLDVHDLGLDRSVDWSSSSAAGRANQLFAAMMTGLYDALIEHLSRRLFALEKESDSDALIGIIKRRRELADVVVEKSAKKKEQKEKEQAVDMHQCSVHTPARTIASLLEKLVDPNGPMVGDGVLAGVRMDLLEWAISRCSVIAAELRQSVPSRHHAVLNTPALVTMARLLLDIYVGKCADWLKVVDSVDPLKTSALVAYAELTSWLLDKYRDGQGDQIHQLFPIWERDEVTEESSSVAVDRSLLKHAHFLVVKILQSLLAMDAKEGEEKKKVAAEIEKQAKAITKVCGTLLVACSTMRASVYMFKKVGTVLKSNEFSNNTVLREVLRVWQSAAFASGTADATVRKSAVQMARHMVACLAGDDVPDGDEWACVGRGQMTALSECLNHLVTRTLHAVREAVAFAVDFGGVREGEVDCVMCECAVRLEWAAELIHRLLPLHVDFAREKERTVHLLTVFYNSIDAPVKLMLDVHKTQPVAEWKAVGAMADVLQGKVVRIMAVADEKVGQKDPDDERNKNSKRRLQQTMKEKDLFVKWVRAREQMQSRVLLLCAALKDDRLDLQVKNNSIGMRDFRIDMRKVMAKIAEKQREEEEEREKEEEERQREQDNSVGDATMGGDADEGQTTQPPPQKKQTAKRKKTQAQPEEEEQGGEATSQPKKQTAKRRRTAESKERPVGRKGRNAAARRSASVDVKEEPEEEGELDDTAPPPESVDDMEL